MVLQQRRRTDDKRALRHTNKRQQQQLGGASPVVEVHDGLESAAAPRGDVSLEARQQRRHHVHSVLSALSESI